MTATIVMNWNDKGIRGDVTARGYEGLIDLHACVLGAQRPIKMQSGTAKSRIIEPPSMNNISLTRFFDMSSGALFQECLFGKGASVKIYYLKSGRGQDSLDCFLELHLSDVLVTYWALNTLTESVHVTYSKITARYLKSGSSNQALEPTAFGFDMLLGRRC